MQTHNHKTARSREIVRSTAIITEKTVRAMCVCGEGQTFCLCCGASCARCNDFCAAVSFVDFTFSTYSLCCVPERIHNDCQRTVRSMPSSSTVFETDFPYPLSAPCRRRRSSGLAERQVRCEIDADVSDGSSVGELNLCGRRTLAGLTMQHYNFKLAPVAVAAPRCVWITGKNVSICKR